MNEQLEFNFEECCENCPLSNANKNNQEPSEEDLLFLEVAVEEAIKRIKKGYKLTDGKIYLSFSGGKDSTVLGELIKMANLETYIPFVFADTKIELDATVRFVKEYEYPNKVFLKPRKPFGQILKEYGKPAISKMKSELLGTFHRQLEKENENMLDMYRVKMLLGSMFSPFGILAKKHFQFLHPDLEYKVANKCCLYMKKYPFQDYAKKEDMNGYYSGIRTAEGGARKLAYDSCTQFKKIGKKEMVNMLPIYDWSDEMVELFIKVYNVKLSDAYEVYGFERTGCIACPFSKNLPKELPIIKKYEPLKYKACIKWLGDVYMDMGIKIPDDEEYMKKFNERQKVIEQRRKEMQDKYLYLREERKKKEKEEKQDDKQ